MRFFILSDLHLRAEVEKYKTSDLIKKLCSKIRKNTYIGETILIIFLGDIANKGEMLSFDTARDNLSLIVSELNEYPVKFEFVPGNHDIENSSLNQFDKLISEFGCRHSFESSSVYSNVYDGVNFIFADSTITRKYNEPGKIDITAIHSNVKPGITNILFTHHAISDGHGSPHDVIEDSATVLAQLNSIGISFFFHGHVHDANITIPQNGLVEIGCGSLCGDISWLKDVFHQFLVGYIQDKRIVQIERWISTEDGHGDFALSGLYPKPKEFSDPDSIGKISYDPVPDYIPRCVLSYEDSTQTSFLRFMNQGKLTHLRGALQDKKKILLLCDAGMGKSVELKNLAYELSDIFHTFLYSLENYSGQNIEDLLPDTYKNLPPSRIALLLDGYDELDSEHAKTFKRKLELYAQDASATNVVISSRSNFCGNENSNESRTFPGFCVYVLEKLSKEDVKTLLCSRGIDFTQFVDCARLKGVHDLIYSPFYLFKLAGIFARESDLPPKNQLMDKLITETFDEDNSKFSGDLDSRYLELFKALEKVAFTMQLMHKQALEDRDEYQALIPFAERELIKRSGLFKRDGNGWKFVHNNFREYLVAKYMSKLPEDSVISIIYDGTDIKPYWVNTLGYLTGFVLGWNLVDWLVENSPSALVKFEPDRLNESSRIEVFRRIFDKFESKRLYFNDDLCNENELAYFVNSSEILDFLLDRISNPQHYISQYNAIKIFKEYPSLFGEDNTAREILLDCCDKYPTTDKTVCRLAMQALIQHNLQTPETTQCLMDKFRDVNEDYIRLGMYEYLYAIQECDSYVEYLLSGIEFITYSLNDHNRIVNESYELVKCLKRISTVESVARLFEWFSQERHPDFYDSDKVIESAVETAVTLYKSGNEDLFDALLPFYLKTAKECNTDISRALAKFFVKTDTQYSAVLLAADEFENEPCCISDLVNYDSTVIEYLKSAYLDGSLRSHRAFHEIVCWYVRDEKRYEEYADLIRKNDNVDLPELRKPVDYDALERQSEHEYIDALFNEEKRLSLTAQLIREIGNPDLMTSQLIEAGVKIDYYSALRHLQCMMYNANLNVKVAEFFSKVNFDDFVLWSISHFLNYKDRVILTKTKKEKLTDIVANRLKNNPFKGCITYHEDSLSFSSLIPALLSVILYLDYPLDEATLLDLTELPYNFFENGNEQAKYLYLQDRLTIEKIKYRLINNVKTERVRLEVLRDHFDFFDSCKDPALAEYALKMCNNQVDTFLRSTSWRYLYNTLGAEYVANKILPIADEALLLEIASSCKDISEEKLSVAMEREYKKKPSILLQAHLITFGSDIAINDYIAKVSEDKQPPEGTGIHTDGPTAAIGSISNPVFLPQLETLLITVLDPNFIDCSWGGLRTSLTRAFTNCSMKAYEETIVSLIKHRPSADVNEINFRYCNYIIDGIEHARKSLLDTPKTLSEAIAFLDEVSRITNQQI